jgi:hypothetical protein
LYILIVVVCLRECIGGSVGAFLPGHDASQLSDVIEEAFAVCVPKDATKEQLQFALAEFLGDSMLTYATYDTALTAAGECLDNHSQHDSDIVL